MSALQSRSCWEMVVQFCPRSLELAVMDAVTSSTVVAACETGSQWVRALEVFCHGQESSLRLDVGLCNVMMHACKGRQLWDWLLLSLAGVVQSGLEPDILTLN